MDTSWYTRTYYNNDSESVAEGVYLVGKEVEKLKGDVTDIKQKIKELTKISRANQKDGEGNAEDEESYENVERYIGVPLLLKVSLGKQFTVEVPGDYENEEDRKKQIEDVFETARFTSTALRNIPEGKKDKPISYSDSDSDDSSSDSDSDSDSRSKVLLRPEATAGGDYIGNIVDAALAPVTTRYTMLSIATLRDGHQKVYEIPYSREKKYHVVIYKDEIIKEYRLIMKGDMDVVLSRCSRMKSAGEEKELTDEGRQAERKKIKGARHNFMPPILIAQTILSKDEYPDGPPTATEVEELLQKDLCYLGTILFQRKLSNDSEQKESKSVLKKALSGKKRVVLITGMPPYAAASAAFRKKKLWTIDGESPEEMAERYGENSYFEDDTLTQVKRDFGANAIADCSRMRDFTRDDLQQMLFGTEELLLANARPLLKVAMVTECILCDVVPVLTSPLTISGTPVADARAAVRKCREVGIKAILLTSAEDEEARSQALELGIFTKKSQTTEDIAKRLQCSVKEIWPRKAKSKVVTRDEMVGMTVADMQNVMRNFPEVVFSGLNEAQKEVPQCLGNAFDLFVVC